jgi:ABC-type dipeptide/oligopeptide/nickel transport system permease subunit
VEYIQQSPSRVALQKLFANKPAILGLLVIIFAHLVAGLGYAIMPDNSPDANESMQEIQKKGLFFQATILRDAQDKLPAPRKLIELWRGREHGYKPIAVRSYTVRDDSLSYQLYSTGLRGQIYANQGGGQQDSLKHVALIEMVKPLYPLPSQVPSWGRARNFYRTGDSIIYLTLAPPDGQPVAKKIAIADLRTEFEAQHVQKRTFYLGTDRDGRDMMSRLIYGTRIALTIGFVAVVISLLVGVSLGAIGGFFGGRIDAAILWLMTVVWSIPSIMLVVAFRMALGTNEPWVLFVAVGLTTWVEIARVVRGEIMGIKHKLYVEAARAFGFNNWRIIYRHILPNVLGSIIVLATSNFASAIILEAGLSFLGLGVTPPTPSWGGMLLEGFEETKSFRSLHLIVLPSLCISLLVLAFNLLGNGLRDAFDPKFRN